MTSLIKNDKTKKNIAKEKYNKILFKVNDCQLEFLDNGNVNNNNSLNQYSGTVLTIHSDVNFMFNDAENIKKSIFDYIGPALGDSTFFYKVRMDDIDDHIVDIEKEIKDKFKIFTMQNSSDYIFKKRSIYCTDESDALSNYRVFRNPKDFIEIGENPNNKSDKLITIHIDSTLICKLCYREKIRDILYDSAYDYMHSLFFKEIEKILQKYNIECTLRNRKIVKNLKISMRDKVFYNGVQTDNKSFILLNMSEGVLEYEKFYTNSLGCYRNDYSKTPKYLPNYLPRIHSKKNIDCKMFEKELNGIYTTSDLEKNKYLSKECFMDTNLFKKELSKKVNIINIYKPIMNIKLI